MWWQARMARASNEISHWAEYDYVVINDDLDATLDEDPDHPGRRAHEARPCQTGIPAFVSKLMR